MAVKSNTQGFLIRVSCMTYNQSNYIIDALDGFMMQQTDFPFVCTIVDDASTDGEQEIIKNYVQMHFDLQDSSVAYERDTDYGHVTFARHKTNEKCYFAVIFLKENHYSQKKSKAPYLTEWKNTKYIAICEGDDYWTDPFKLQKQVEYMEEHQDCCMTACAANWEMRGEIIKNDRISTVPRDLTTEEVILGGGGYLATCSLVYNNDKLNKNVPKWRKIANVGDYPLQIQGTLVGKLHYFPEIMCVYRYGTDGSWTNKYLKNNIELTQIHRRKEIIWMKELDRDTNKKYQKEIYRHLIVYYPSLYQNRMASIKEYWHCVRIVGKYYQYWIMIKTVMNRILNYHYDKI